MIIFQLLLLIAAGASSAVAQSIKVTLLGTGTPRPDPERMGAATLIEAGEETLLIDVGRGTTVRLLQAGVDPAAITGVFVTHLHSDHVTGLPDLWLLGHVPQWYRPRSLRVVGPRGVEAMTKGIAAAFARDVELRGNPTLPGSELEALEFADAGVVFDRNGVRVTAISVNHVPDAYAYRVDFQGRSVVISGDAAPSEALIAASVGVDLLVHEVMAIDTEFMRTRPVAAQRAMRAILRTHTTPDQAAEIFARTEPRLAVFNHISLTGLSEAEALEIVRGGYGGRVLMGYDLLTIIVDEDVTVRSR